MKTKILRIMEDDAPYGGEPLEMFALVVSDKNINLSRLEKVAKEYAQKMIDDDIDCDWDERVNGLIKYCEDKIKGIKIIADVEDFTIYCN